MYLEIGNCTVNIYVFSVECRYCRKVSQTLNSNQHFQLNLKYFNIVNELKLLYLCFTYVENLTYK